MGDLGDDGYYRATLHQCYFLLPLLDLLVFPSKVVHVSVGDMGGGLEFGIT